MKRIFKNYSRSASALFFAAAVLSACSGVSIDNDSPPEKQYAEGERLLKKERFLEAADRFRILKSRYPYSKYAALATLKIADTHYEEEAFIEASAAYKTFRELYPKHEMSSYALFRIGESEWNQIPSTPDRDLNSANAAIDAYKELIKSYPESPYTKNAAEKIDQLRSKLAEKEDYVGNFYFIRENFTAAANRYKFLLDTYPGLGHDEKALYRLAFSYEKIGDYTKAEETLDRLNFEHPKGEFTTKAHELAQKIQKEKTNDSR